MTDREKKAEINKRYRENNSDKVKEINKRYRENNSDKVKEFYQNNKEKISKTQKKYQKLNKAQLHEKRKIWESNNSDKIKAYHKQYQKTNKEEIKLKKKKYREANKEIIAKNKLEYVRNKTKNDPLFKLKRHIRSMIGTMIRKKGFIKKSKTESILCCTFAEFKFHLESQFESWMNWDNRGNPKDGIYEPNKTWDIDHIIPLNTAKTEDELIKLNHYTNLKPLCSYYNRFVKRAN